MGEVKRYWVRNDDLGNTRGHDNPKEVVLAGDYAELEARVREAKKQRDWDVGELYGMLREVLTLLPKDIIAVEIGNALLKRIADKDAAESQEGKE